MRPAAVQASRIMVAFRSSMALPPIFVVPELTQPGGYEYLSMLGLKGAEMFSAQFSWMACLSCIRHTAARGCKRCASVHLPGRVLSGHQKRHRTVCPFGRISVP